MKRSVKFLSFVLAFLMLLPLFSSCSKEPATTAGPMILSDEEAIALYMQRLKDGYYADQAMYDYPDLSVYFEIGQYKNLTYPDAPEVSQEFTDEELDDYITNVVIANLVTDQQYTEIQDGGAQKFDVVEIDYKGYVDGVYDKNASATGQSLLLGSRSYIPGFESGLVGAKAGETRVLELVFSPYYVSQDVAGKPIRFEVTVKKIQRPTIPEITLESMNKLFNTKYETMESFREDLRRVKEADKTDYAIERLNDYLQKKALELSNVKTLPEKELQHYVDHYFDYYTQYVPEGVSLEEYCQLYLNVTLEEFTNNASIYAQNAVKSDLLFLTIAKLENISYTEEQMKSILEGYYAQSKGIYSGMQAFIEDYIKVYGPYYFEHQIVRALVLDLMYQSAEKQG